MVEALAANDDPEGAYEVIQGALADPNTKGAGPCGQRRMMFGRPWQAYRSVEVYDDLEYFRMTDLSFSEPALYDLYDKLFFGCNGLGLDLAALKGNVAAGGLVTAVTYSSVLKSLNHKKCFYRVWEIYEETLWQLCVGGKNCIIPAMPRQGECCQREDGHSRLNIAEPCSCFDKFLCIFP